MSVDLLESGSRLRVAAEKNSDLEELGFNLANGLAIRKLYGNLNWPCRCHPSNRDYVAMT
jgi:hypothetical protein